MDVKLLVQSGEREGQEIVIEDEEFVIGRDRTCQFRINHYLVSQRHCRLVRDGGRVSVEDLNSATGTKVNDQPIDTAEVRNGDRLKVGSESFLVAIVTDQDVAAGRGRPRSIDGIWTKLRVIENQGIASVYFADIALINEIEILEVDRELGRLIEMGHNLIALNFGNLAHLSSQVIGTVLKAYRRCTADGGMLKICQIHPDVVEIFALTGLYRTIEIFPTEPMALESAWPTPSRRPTPPEAKPVGAATNGKVAPGPRSRARGNTRPAAPADSPDLGALSVPLADFLAADERLAPPVRPSPVAQSARNGVDASRPGRGVGGDSRPHPPAAAADPGTDAIPLDDEPVAPARRVVAPPRSTSVAPATPSQNGVGPSHAKRGAGSDPRPAAPTTPPDLAELPILPDDDFGTPSPGYTVPVPRPAAVAPAPQAMPPTNGLHASHEGRGMAGHGLPAAPAVPPAYADDRPAPPARSPRRVRLIALTGKSQGQAVEVSTPQFFIGRDSCCHLHAASPAVRPIHAIVEQRDGRVFLRDVGCSAGTTINDRPLEDAEVEAADGDVIQVGPLRFSIAIDPVGAAPAPTRPAPQPSVSANGHSGESHLHPVYQCPECGTEGWASIEQILPQILLAIGHALSRPPQTDSPPPLMSLRRAPSSRGSAPPSPPRMEVAHPNGNGKAHHHPETPVAPAEHADSPFASRLDGVPDGWEFGPAGAARDADAPPAPSSNGHGPQPPQADPLLPPDLLTDGAPGAPTADLPANPPRGPQAPRSLDLDFRCPNCGAEGWIPVNRLGGQLQCTSCHAKLFTDAGGELHVGDLSHGSRDRTVPAPRRSDPLGTVLNGWKNSLGRPPTAAGNGSASR
jgi:anti-sigma B factor antagonist